MREPASDVVVELTPERVVPAELTAAKNVVFIERVQICAHLVDRGDGAVHVRRDVIADARPHAAFPGALKQFGNAELTVGKRRVRMAIDGKPPVLSLVRHARIVRALRQGAVRATCRGERGSCRVAACAGRSANPAGARRSRAAAGELAAAPVPRPERRPRWRRGWTAARPAAESRSSGWRCRAAEAVRAPWCRGPARSRRSVWARY